MLHVLVCFLMFAVDGQPEHTVLGAKLCFLRPLVAIMQLVQDVGLDCRRDCDPFTLKDQLILNGKLIAKGPVGL